MKKTVSKRRFRTHTNPFNYDKVMPVLNLKETFPKFKGLVDVEFGFGKGVFLRSWAKAHPERFLVGFEIRKLLVSYVKEKCEQESVSNVFLVHGAAKNGLEGSLQTCKIENVFIFHPDPWFKKKHHKRRLVNKAFIETLTPLLVEGANLYILTDVEELFIEIQDVFNNFPFFKKNQSTFWEGPYESHWSAFSKEEHRTHFRVSYSFFKVSV